MAMQTGKIKENPSVVQACANAKAKTGRLHLLGLVSMHIVSRMIGINQIICKIRVFNDAFNFTYRKKDF